MSSCNSCRIEKERASANVIWRGTNIAHSVREATLEMQKKALLHSCQVIQNLITSES